MAAVLDDDEPPPLDALSLAGAASLPLPDFDDAESEPAVVDPESDDDDEVDSDDEPPDFAELDFDDERLSVL